MNKTSVYDLEPKLQSFLSIYYNMLLLLLFLPAQKYTITYVENKEPRIIIKCQISLNIVSKANNSMNVLEFLCVFIHEGRSLIFVANLN